MPVLAWMLVIFGMSTDIGSAAHTSRYLIPFLFWLDPHISWQTIDLVELLMRKGAHLTEYAILALLLLRGFRGLTNLTFAWRAGVTLAIAVCYAASDEFHQTFVASRTASPHDVMIDTCGAIIGLVVYAVLSARFGGDRSGIEAA